MPRSSRSARCCARASWTRWCRATRRRAAPRRCTPGSRTPPTRQVGDTNATEALQVLRARCTKYTARSSRPRSRSRHAIKRLEAKTRCSRPSSTALEHDRGAASPRHSTSWRRSPSEERATRATLTRLDTERRASLGERRAPPDQVRRRAARGRSRSCARRSRVLESSAHLPANAEAELRETVARYEEAQRNLETLESRRRDEVQKERGRARSRERHPEAVRARRGGRRRPAGGAGGRAPAGDRRGAAAAPRGVLVSRHAGRQGLRARAHPVPDPALRRDSRSVSRRCCATSPTAALAYQTEVAGTRAGAHREHRDAARDRRAAQRAAHARAGS